MVKEQQPSVRDRLLAAGVTVFSKSGFNGCSVQDITDAAGVPKGSFYNHFESKEALGAAALQYYWNSGIAERQMLNPEEPSPLARLRRYFTEATAEIVAKDFTCGCLIGNMTAELSDHSAIISKELSAIFANWTQRVADCIAEAQRAGEITSKADPAILATFALNAWEGALLRARIEKGSGPLQQFVDILFTQLLR
jgi:TetR/AcrR family transcriptional repressor of nem operon